MYIPLGGSRGGVGMKVRNTFIIFLVSGFWHGANWTFIVWGALNAIYFLPLLLTKRNRQNMEVVANNSILSKLKDFVADRNTFSLTVIAWVFFRADNIGHAISYLGGMFSESLFSVPYYEGIGYAIKFIPLILLFLFVEWQGRRGDYGIYFINKVNIAPIRYVFYFLLVIITFYFGNFGDNQFIYFQF